MKTYLLTDKIQFIGRAGEQGGITIAIDVSDWQQEYADGVGGILVTRPGGDRKPLVTEISGGLMLAVLPQECTDKPGRYDYTATWTLAGAIQASRVYQAIILSSEIERGEPDGAWHRRTPDWAKEIYLQAETIRNAIDAAMQMEQSVLEARDDAQAAMEDAEDAEAGAGEERTAAETARSGAEAAQVSAEQAAADAATAKTAAETAAASASAAYGTDLLADIFSTSKTYAEGEYVIYDGNLYRCVSDVTTAGAWIADNWTEVQVGGEMRAARDNLSDLRSAFNADTTREESFVAGDWEQGLINSITGADSTSSTTIRSIKISAAGISSIVCVSGYKCLLFGYNNNTYLGWWKGDAFVKESGAAAYYSTSLYIESLRSAGANNIRVCVKRDDGADIVPGDGTNVSKLFALPKENASRLNQHDGQIININETLNNCVLRKSIFSKNDWEQGTINSTGGTDQSSSNTIRSIRTPVTAIDSISCESGYKCLAFCYNKYSFLGWWKDGAFYKGVGAASYYASSIKIGPIRTAGATHVRICAKREDETDLTPSSGENVAKMIAVPIENASRIDDVSEALNDQKKTSGNLTDLVSAQKALAEDWHFGFIDVFESLGLGSKHVIPGTATIWNPSGTVDLNQKEVWMSDGVHPFKGSGVTDMYARTIAGQLAMIVPSYRNGIGETTPSLWAGRNILWMGTSIPAGSDPEAGDGSGATYPALVSNLLGATVVNKARGSSCVRINASTGTYTGMVFNHFVRALSRTIAECDLIASNWDSIKEQISGAPAELSADQLAIMKSHSFENLLLPYLDGTNAMPDLFVIDHGHNDVRPLGVNGKNDLWISPSEQAISDGILAEDTYMTANSFANLKTALNDDLSKIGSINAFAASLNRNCFKGAVNFIITLILRYNPYARIVIVSDYN